MLLFLIVFIFANNQFQSISECLPRDSFNQFQICSRIVFLPIINFNRFQKCSINFKSVSINLKSPSHFFLCSPSLIVNQFQNCSINLRTQFPLFLFFATNQFQSISKVFNQLEMFQSISKCPFHIFLFLPTVILTQFWKCSINLKMPFFSLLLFLLAINFNQFQNACRKSVSINFKIVFSINFKNVQSIQKCFFFSLFYFCEQSISISFRMPAARQFQSISNLFSHCFLPITNFNQFQES